MGRRAWADAEIVPNDPDCEWEENLCPKFLLLNAVVLEGAARMLVLNPMVSPHFHLCPLPAIPPWIEPQPHRLGLFAGILLDIEWPSG